MGVRTITNNECSLTVQTVQKTSFSGESYWQARAMFRIAAARARARVDVVTTARHPTPESAEAAAIALARRNGWGAS